MKKLVMILIFFLFLITIYNKEDSIYVMSTIENNNKYELDFTNENLNFNNFKLKLATFTSYDFKITKVYIDYDESIKEYFNKDYFSFASNNLSLGIDRLKEEYNIVLKENHVYEESIENVSIKMIEIYTTEDALTIFKDKYPSVIINRVQ